MPNASNRYFNQELKKHGNERQRGKLLLIHGEFRRAFRISQVIIRSDISCHRRSGMIMIVCLHYWFPDV
jgi:hypothetical protein